MALAPLIWCLTIWVNGVVFATAEAETEDECWHIEATILDDARNTEWADDKAAIVSECAERN